MQKQITHNDLPQAVGLLLEKVERMEFMLAQANELAPLAPQNDIIKADEAANLLGITKNSLYQRTSKGEIPFIKLNNSTHIRFSRKDLIDWVRSGNRKTE